MATDEFSPYGLDLFGEPIRPQGQGALAQRYEFPPFSVLDARQGEWQDRKRAWLALGIESEVGRSAKAITLHDWMEKNEDFGKARARGDGTSIFDPVLCELMYRWFCPKGGLILDPFAGGSVRGIVAGFLDRRYRGWELRQEQVTANFVQRDKILPPGVDVGWACADSTTVEHNPMSYDFLFSCPPYGDLEVYSEDPRDLSTMDATTFFGAHARVILKSVQGLRDNRFAVWVVGDYRDKRSGHLQDFVSETIKAFRNAGMALYNEAILVTGVGSLPIRAGKAFEASRKLGKTHQNVLVFVKGDPRRAAELCRDNS